MNFVEKVTEDVAKKIVKINSECAVMSMCLEYLYLWDGSLVKKNENRFVSSFAAVLYLWSELEEMIKN